MGDELALVASPTMEVIHCAPLAVMHPDDGKVTSWRVDMEGVENISIWAKKKKKDERV